MKVVNNSGEVIEVTETAYNIIYKKRGFKKYTKPKEEKPKTTNKNKSTSSTNKKVNKSGTDKSK